MVVGNNKVCYNGFVFMVAIRALPYEMIFVVHVDVILSIFWFVCISLSANFYVLYLAARNWNRTRIRPVNVLFN